MRRLLRLLHLIRRPGVERLPNPPWSLRDQQVAIDRARQDWLG